VKRILAIDDELGTRASLQAIFSRNYDIATAAGADEAMDALSRDPVDVVILDIRLAGENGLDVLKNIKGLYPDLPVVMLSASTTAPSIVTAMRLGAYDYVTKPFAVEDVVQAVAHAIENSNLQRRVASLENDVAQEFPVEAIIGGASAFQRAIFDLITSAATDSTVLITGETGTGKELAARLLHARSNRAGEPFVPVHCASLPEALIESELFGHEKGAFTNALRQKPGRFDLAGAGTLFFDELGEIPLATQVKLLRVLQDGEFMRVGGTQVIKTRARFVAATTRSLIDEVRLGRFRDDLFYRINVVPVSLPPLRERLSDIPLLADHFLRALRTTLGATTESFAPDAMNLMVRYAWPGNVRELRNIVERMLVLHGKEKSIRPEFLPREFYDATTDPADRTDASESLEDTVNAYERAIIAKALAKARGVQSHAATALGTTRRILKYRMEKLKIASTTPDAI